MRWPRKSALVLGVLSIAREMFYLEDKDTTIMDRLHSLGACSVACVRAEREGAGHILLQDPAAQEMWDRCTRGDWMIWLLEEHVLDRGLPAALVACDIVEGRLRQEEARNALKTVRQCLQDGRDLPISPGRALEIDHTLYSLVSNLYGSHSAFDSSVGCDGDSPAEQLRVADIIRKHFKWEHIRDREDTPREITGEDLYTGEEE